MNKELIKKYKTEFDHWLNGGKLLYNCGQSWIECLKSFRWDNDVRNDLQFIINDEYVEFRKALVEGKTLQLNEAEKFGDPKRGWVDLSCTDLGHSRVLFPVEFYRIKPEEPQFKVGDFVRVSSPSGVQFVAIITSINKDNTVTLNGNTVAYLSDCIKWEQQAGELCWFTDNKEEQRAVLEVFKETTSDNKFGTYYTMWKHCEPFLNSKPSWFKD